MKKLILLSVVILLSFTIDEIPKGTNKILIYTGKNQTENYKQVGKYLIDNDFQFVSNSEFYTFKTEFKNVKKSNVKYSLNIICKDSNIIVSGSGKIELGYKSEVFNIEKKGMKGSPLINCFNEMLLFCDGFSTKNYMKYE